MLGAPNKTPGISIAPSKKQRNFRPALLMHFHTAADTIGIEKGEEAVPVIVGYLFSTFFLRLKKKENPRGHAYLCI
jgi:hypothetical protein